MGAINFASFFVGFEFGKRSKTKDAVKVSDDNAKALGELANLINFTGGR